MTIGDSHRGKVVWSLVAAMAPATLIGGNVGGRVASALPPQRLRAFVVAFGVIESINYFVE